MQRVRLSFVAAFLAAGAAMASAQSAYEVSGLSTYSGSTLSTTSIVALNPDLLQAVANPPPSDCPPLNYEKTYTKGIGNSDIGASVQAKAKAAQGYGKVEIYGHIVGNAHLLGYTAEVARVEALSKLEGTTHTNKILVKAAGITLYSLSKTYHWTWTWSGTKKVFDFDKTYWLGPVPVELGVSAGVGFEAHVQFGAAGYEVGAIGYAKAWMYGEAHAGVGGEFLGVGASAGVQAELDLFNSMLALALGHKDCKLSGVAVFDMVPVTIKLKLYAKISYLIDSSTWTWTIISWSMSPVYVVLLSI